MRQFGVVLTVLGLVSSAQAAEVTRVASSFEDKDPFGMFLNFTYQYTQDRGKITREWYQSGTTEDVTELRYQMIEQKLGIDMHLGIYKDLELHFGLPIIFQQDRSWAFAEGTGPDNSSIYRNCSDARGGLCTTPGFGTGRLFEVGDASNSYRGGLGNVTVGMAWAPFVQSKDDTKPTWTLRVDYEIPSAALLDPSKATSEANRGVVGDRVHRYTFSTAVSKKLSFFEPYFALHYTLPWKGPGWYSNCDNPGVSSMGHPENCGAGNDTYRWTREETGLRPSHVGGFLFGSELTLFERADRFQRFAFDIRGWGTYVSEGRYYNEMSDLFGKLMYTSDYGQVGAHVGIVGQAAEFILVRAYASLAYNTERFLTYENIGHDMTGNNVVDVSTAPQELSPNYDFRTDRVGRRFRMEEQSIFKIMLTVNFNF